jgi:ornithine carbamoyltransferase
MANSWILGAHLFSMKISLGGPARDAPTPKIRALATQAGADFHFTSDPYEAVAGADIVYTDVWASMGQEGEAVQRRQRMLPFQVNRKLFAAAKADALFMHCLPAHAGDEVTQAVLNNPRCVIFDEAENRLHVQKAILATLAGKR